MSSRTWSRWQSGAETLALIVIAAAVARVAIVKSPSEASPSRAAGPTRAAEPPLPVQPISLEGAQTLGSQTARIGFVVYSDFQCPYCGKFARETLPAIEEQYVRTGKVLLAFRQFPLPNHQFAEKAAEAAVCAGRQNRFWAFHDDLFAHQQALDAVSLQNRAQRLGLKISDFVACLDGQTAASIQADRTGGAPLGISGTPTFLVGPMLRDGRLKVSYRFSGAQPLAEFQGVLDRLLATAISAR